MAVEVGGEWRLSAVAASYGRFLLALREPSTGLLCAVGVLPDAVALLSTTQQLCGRLPDVVAVDMPMARHPITSRRASDQAVSKSYGARHASTHTPSAVRPRWISNDLRAGFAASGYGLATTHVAPPFLIEVYPHPALIELADALRRLPYKIQRQRDYWPDATPQQRRELLLAEWRRILVLLEYEIAGSVSLLPLPDATAPLTELKAFEDSLDAVVCAWVGVCALTGRAAPFGDRSPRSRYRRQ